jgi:biotin synthase
MLSRSDILDILFSDGQAQLDNWAKARAQREANWGKTAIVRGAIEITNVCRRNCDYCSMRRGATTKVSAYYMTVREILAAAEAMRDSGVRVVFLQGGETPHTTRTVGAALPAIKKLFGGDVEIVLCLGVKTLAELKHLRDQGADSYVLKHETSDPDLHSRLRHESLKVRIACLEHLLSLGYRVGTGCIVGLPGQTVESIADDIILADELGVHMMSAAPFIPAEGTPCACHAYAPLRLTLNAIAAMRLRRADWLIPSVSAMEKIESGGQVRGLMAGANVVTVNFTPTDRRTRYLIYGRARYIVGFTHALRIITDAGLRPNARIVN